ncbi:MAG: hypothetical protein NZM28_08430 [Fimbriimonadales bacterium]|nr:hypothetical protein [Fimbriimonadales bacterium]
MVSITQDATAAAFQAAQRLRIHLPDSETAVRYLSQHPQLARAMPDILACIREALPDAVLSLEVYTDPESDDMFLAVYARWAEYDAKTQTRLQNARDAYRSLLPPKEGWLFLTTDYQPAQGDV